MAMKRALVYGWYGHGNVGDELMKAGIAELLKRAECSATFTDVLVEKDVVCADIVIIGGGCVLDRVPKTDNVATGLLASGSVPVAFISVGLETEVCDFFAALLRIAMCVIVRSPSRLEWVRELNAGAELAPDIAYSVLNATRPHSNERRGVLFLPNVEVMPRRDSAHWVHLAWDVFRSECSQFLDELIIQGNSVTFATMCRNDAMDDAWTAVGIASMMKARSLRLATSVPYASIDVHDYDFVITQRYHGIVVAETACIPYISIDHHNKLAHAWPHRGCHISYYGTNKHDMLSAFAFSYGVPLSQDALDMSPYEKFSEALRSA